MKYHRIVIKPFDKNDGNNYNSHNCALNVQTIQSETSEYQVKKIKILPL